MGTWGCGMPASLYLDQFADHVGAVFGARVYMVGSATHSTAWRDVDVRVLLGDREWKRLFPKLDPRHTSEYHWHLDAKWVALTLAFSELGKRLTGLPIDFQVQPARYANEYYPPPACPRNPIGRPVEAPPVARKR